MYDKYSKTKIQEDLKFAIEQVTICEKEGKKIMAGRKSKYSSNTNKTKLWQVALYIRLSQEDIGIRRGKK